MCGLPAWARLDFLPAWQLGSKDKVSQESPGEVASPFVSEVSEHHFCCGLNTTPPGPQIQGEGMQTLLLDGEISVIP